MAMNVVAGQRVVDAMQAQKAALVSRSALGFNSEQLCNLQVKQANAGFLGIEVVKSIHGWSVRYDSGLQNFALVRTARELGGEGSIEAAEQFARDWCANDPDHRYAWVRV